MLSAFLEVECSLTAMKPLSLLSKSPFQEGAAPKSINEEVGFLLRLMGDPGDLLRIRLRKRKVLKLKAGRSIAKAYTDQEKERMMTEARRARSPHIYPAIMLALNAGIQRRGTETVDLGSNRSEEGILDCWKEQDRSG